MRAQFRAAGRDAVRARAVILTPGSCCNIGQAEQGNPHILQVKRNFHLPANTASRYWAPGIGIGDCSPDGEERVSLCAVMAGAGLLLLLPGVMAGAGAGAACTDHSDCTHLGHRLAWLLSRERGGTCIYI